MQLTETSFKNVSDMFQDAIDKYGERPLFGVKTAGVYRWITFSEFDVRMRKLRSIMHKMGIEKGDRVAIIANNSVQFALAVYASYGLGAVVVPMYEVQKLQDWDYILRNSGTKLLFAGTDEIRKQIEALNIPDLQHILVIRPSDPKEENAVDRLIDAEIDLLPTQDVSGDDLANIIYTSGTTGNPKGVELTHTNLVQDVLKTRLGFHLFPTDRTMAFLPWAHAFGMTVELLLFPSVGAAVGLVESNRTIAQNLLEVNPTVLISVPKIFNKIYDTIHQRVADKAVARALFNRAETLTRKARDHKLSALDNIQSKVLDRVVGAKVRGAFGNSLRFCISGGAALSEEVASFFIGFGVDLYEGYGMSETSPIIAVNDMVHGRKVGSVGKPLPGVDVRIDVDPDSENDKQGEVVVIGHIVMKQYHNLPTETAEVLTNGNELHTGDMGYIDDDGFLWLTGRVKEQYKLENGKYVVPSALEARITTSTIIETCVIFGAGMPYNVMLITPTKEFMDKFVKDNHLESASQSELEKNDKLHEALSAEIKTMTQEFRGYEKPRKFVVTLDEFTIQNGLITPALKIKRREVEKKYGDALKALYKE